MIARGILMASYIDSSTYDKNDTFKKLFLKFFFSRVLNPKLLTFYFQSVQYEKPLKLTTFVDLALLIFLTLT